MTRRRHLAVLATLAVAGTASLLALNAALDITWDPAAAALVALAAVWIVQAPLAALLLSRRTRP